MQRKMNVAVAVATAVVLAACADGATPKARVTEPEASADFVSVAASCTNSAYSSYKRSAGDYSSERNDPVVTLFGVLQKATTPTARKQAALDILARLDVIRSTGLAKSSVDGGKAAVAAIGCGGLGTPPSDALMASAMDLGPSGGVFKVVGAGSDASTTAAVAAGATPVWGAEPYDSDALLPPEDRVSTWGAAFPNDRVLLYAYRIPTMTGFEGIPLDASSVAFDMTTAPQVDPVENSVNIFVCAGESQSRIQSRQFILSPWTPRYCLDLPSPTSSTTKQGFGSQLLAWLSPKPLYASMILIGTGGVKSGWSPKGLVKVDPNMLFIELVEPIAAASLADGAISVKVRAYAQGTSRQLPTGDVKIVVSVAGNNGIGSDGLIPTATGYTDDDGNVTIPFNTTKTGSFTLRIDGYFVGSPLPVTIITNPFNVRP